MSEHDPFEASARLSVDHDEHEAEDGVTNGFGALSVAGPEVDVEEADETVEDGFIGQERPAEGVYYGDSMTVAGDASDERVQKLEEELARAVGEKEAFEAQYQSLLGKLTTMRNTLGDKLKQDADELDRREEEISLLRQENEDFAGTIETLKHELISSHEDSERAHSELEQLRMTAFDSQRQTTDEASGREVMLREAQEDLERVRIEREEWEAEAMRERVAREQLEEHVQQLELDLAHVKTELAVMTEDRDRHAESEANLQAVLEEFQSAKDREVRQTVQGLESQLQQAREQLASLRQRATTAEQQLAQSNDDSEKVLQLQKEVKEKNLLIGKVRHEAVILNEHLTEALRRLRRDSSDHSVDRRLVSNVLITFLNTPRGDTKRFQMLQVLSSILAWNDDQKEQVGLQKSAGGISGPGIASSRRNASRQKGGKDGADAESIGENESFSNLWIEFLLKESSRGQQDQGNRGTGPSPSASGVTSPVSPMSPPLVDGQQSQNRFNFGTQLPPPTSPPPNSGNNKPTGHGRKASLSSLLPMFSRASSETARTEAPPSVPEDS